MIRLIICLFICTISFNKAYAAFEIGDKIKFSIPDINNKKFYNQNKFNKRPVTIFAFIDDKCLPCLQELQFLKENKSKYQDIDFVLIGTSYRKQTKEFIEKANITDKDFTILNVLDRKNPRKLLKRFGNNSYALPFSIAIKQNSKLCYAKVGKLDHGKINEISNQCL